MWRACFFLFITQSVFAAEFHVVSKDSADFSFVEKYFRSVIEPLYGDQTPALEKISSSKDRVCELLFDVGKDPVGVLVYKKFPVSEFSSLGVQNALEIKTLFVVDAGNNSGRGVGSQLFERVLSVAKNCLCSNLVVTVSEEKKESLAFFQKKGFFVTHTIHGKYKEGTDEYVLVRPL